MRLTTRGRYAVTALLDLALQPTEQTITLAEIAARQTISVAYLEQLFAKLKRHGLVSSVRGANGGYHLARHAEEITVLEIIEAVNETVDATRCDHKGNCQNGAMCLTHDLWQELSLHIADYLAKITLADLVARDNVQTVAVRQNSAPQFQTHTILSLRRKIRITYLEPEPRYSLITPEMVQAALRPDTILVSLMMVNNEIGTVTDVAANCDLYSRANKTVLPCSIACARLCPRVRLKAQIHGGGHERGMRSGTLATHQIVGMGEAFELAGKNLHAEQARLRVLRDKLWNGLQDLEQVFLNGHPEYNVANYLNVSFNFVEGESLMMALKDVAVSSGSACTSATLEPSYVLRALGLSDELAHSSIRFSFGHYTTEEDIDHVIKISKAAVEKLRELSPLWDMYKEAIHIINADPEVWRSIMAYSEKVIDHYENPRNVGVLDKNAENVGTGMVGAPACGDVMRLQIQVNDNGVIEEARFKTYGCGSAIASSSLVTEWLKGKTLDEAQAIKNIDIATELALPPVKVHCSVLAEDAIKAAVEDYRSKKTKA
ncbi:hypothetical protein FQR65_LT17513 [Abscondita terminalis]|nr:hypothetical protein FQR65_LT17513 [Abscondita terminalis]